MITANTVGATNAWGEPPQQVRNHTIESWRWVGFNFRPGDVFIATWAKSGTTWVQQIVAQLIFGAGTLQPLNRISPWLENRYCAFQPTRAILEAQHHKRFLKTHLPANALPYKADARYIYIARDGRDVVWSWHNHHLALRPEVLESLNRAPKGGALPLASPAVDKRRFFLDWLDGDGHPLWPYWSHVKSWWSIRHLPNVLLLHFCDLKLDLVGSIRRIAEFIDMDVAATDIDHIAACCTFDYMKKHSSELLPEYGASMRNGADSFIHRGTGGDWRGTLTSGDVSRFEKAMLESLGWECARWLSQPYPMSNTTAL